MKHVWYTALAVGVLVTVAFCQTARVGPNPALDASNNNYRQDRNGGLVFQSSGDVNKERVARGGCYWAANQGTGVAPGTSLSTTAMIVVYNPQNSGKLIVISKSQAPYFSGTLGTGVLYHCVNTSATQTAPSGGTVLANTPALAGNANNSVAVVRTGATVVAPVIISPLAYLAPELATSVTAPQQTTDTLFDGVALLPGTSYQLQAVAAAGTSPLLSPAVFWEEQPLLNGQP